MTTTTAIEGGEIVSPPRGRKPSALTLLIEDTLYATGKERFKLDTIASQVETYAPIGIIPKYERWRSFNYIKDRIRSIASKKDADGRRIWVAIPSETGEKWWRLLNACDLGDNERRFDYLGGMIRSLKISQNETKKIMVLQRAAAEEGRVLTYGEALVLLEAEA